MPRPKTNYSAEMKRAVYDEFVAAELPRGYFDCWVENKAQEIGCSAASIKNWIGYYREMENGAFGAGNGTPAQTIAALCGASVQRAVSTLARNLTAHNVKIITDRDGNITERAYTPNHEAQNSAAEKILKIHGAFAPDKHVIDVRPANDPTQMSDEALEAEIVHLRQLRPQAAIAGEVAECMTLPAEPLED